MIRGSTPLISSLDLVPELCSVRAARLYATAAFRGWQVPADTVNDAVTIISELAANALRHAGPSPAVEDQQSAGWSASGACTLVLQLWPGHILVFVCDQDRRLPVLRHPSNDAESGRGLQRVNELSKVWGYALPEGAAGKVVWAQIALPDSSESEREHASGTGQPPLPRGLLRSGVAPDT
jgi:hypothetical protein